MPGPAPLRPGLTLVLGGARSGKSRYAEGLAAQASRPIYLATAAAGDAEMAARIAEHRARRGSAWVTAEEPVALPEAIRRHAAADAAVLVDCLTLWVANLMAADIPVGAAGDELAAAIGGAPGPVILVSNEVGLGIVPDNALARAFRDHAGRLHQTLAARADRVVFMVAGLPMRVKGD